MISVHKQRPNKVLMVTGDRVLQITLHITDAIAFGTLTSQSDSVKVRHHLTVIHNESYLD
ncbi:MAG: hypothetical protein KME32_25095 [Mojavia pulchra JT2-VF2]|uniref:Uncharacterized protein n=1 Tax=Mojavia pulchra JT2-VF2 TaxID=287848 RepID=A0A951Q219_9NOST|nr:hypothetical protein [Mojavia pulchra JT2-VF2]